jgi:Ca-activated chloride channel family protein
MRGRLPVIALAVIAVAIAFASSRARDEKAAGRESAATIPAGSLAVRFVYSPEKDVLLAPLIKRFNDEHHEVNGRPVYVQGTSMNSGEAETKIREGELKPVAWSPASTYWGQLLDFEADRRLAPERAPSLVRTPLVIAMWEPMARALGWPRKQLGFADFVRLARSGAGWGDFGHPEWGDFKLVHTNPDFSTSGLNAVVAEYFFATGKREGLTERDVTDPRARAIVRDLERSIVHYGENTLLVEAQMRERGPGYVSAVAMEETTLLSFNRDRNGQPPLVAIYPREGTFYSDNPYMTLNGDWVTPEQRRGAAALSAYLRKAITPEVAAKGGFRPADVGTPPVSPVEEANGVDPAQPEHVLTVPSSRVLARLKQSWREDRKPANVMLVVDVSGSMSEDRRLVSAKKGVRAFLEQAARGDRIGLMKFSDRDEIRTVVPLGTGPGHREKLETAVRGLIANGGTAFYDAVSRAFGRMQRLGHDGTRINAVVLLTDGKDENSDLDLADVVKRLDQGDTEYPVRVFTIAYKLESSDARKALEDIAAASGGGSYTGDTGDIDTVYSKIGSYF